MALQDLVRYVGRCCAQKPNWPGLYGSAEKFDWDAADVLAFQRSERMLPKKMLREVLRELEITPEYAEELLRR